jgi:hypothetical protein
VIFFSFGSFFGNVLPVTVEERCLPVDRPTLTVVVVTVPGICINCGQSVESPLSVITADKSVIIEEGWGIGFGTSL